MRQKQLYKFSECIVSMVFLKCEGSFLSSNYETNLNYEKKLIFLITENRRSSIFE